ncbi:MAG TPA: 50S ribosomal protein L29 [Alcanivoracaceae bacterium]|nr:50S ribosomal protein L29 [Alcanivoracaceae bacterium]
MKANELREKSVEALKEELLALREKQFKQRMALSSGQLTKTHEIREVRKNIARIKTFLTEKAGN